MTTTEAIIRRLEFLPDSVQRQVLDFVEFLEAQRTGLPATKEDIAWSDFSLLGHAGNGG